MSEEIKEPNWENFKKLRDHLATLQETQYRKFDMDGFVTFLSGDIKIGDRIPVSKMRENGIDCGAAACIFGECVIALSDPDKTFEVITGIGRQLRAKEVEDEVMMLLNIGFDDAEHIYLGRFLYEEVEGMPEGYRVDRAYCTIQDAVQYLDLVLETHVIRSRIAVNVEERREAYRQRVVENERRNAEITREELEKTEPEIVSI